MGARARVCAAAPAPPPRAGKFPRGLPASPGRCAFSVILFIYLFILPLRVLSDLSSVAVEVSRASVTRRDTERHRGRAGPGGTGWRGGPGAASPGLPAERGRCSAVLTPLALPASRWEIPALPRVGSIPPRSSPLPPPMLRLVQPQCLSHAFPSADAGGPRPPSLCPELFTHPGVNRLPLVTGVGGTPRFGDPSRAYIWEPVPPASSPWGLFVVKGYLLFFN